MKIWEAYPHIKQELTQVNQIMMKNVGSTEDEFERALKELFEHQGKMLRPAFLILSAHFGKYDAVRFQTLGAVVEMLHMATLIHDDIIDNAKLRRGCESVQSRYGKEFAVYAGDFLFCQCFHMLSEYEFDRKNLHELSKTIKRICLGEIKQFQHRYSTSMDFKNYLSVISKKTAALFMVSFVIGAKEAECDEKLIRLLGKIGVEIGLAFQIIDDLLDYTGETEDIGKSLKNDLKQGYYTLPLIMALEEKGSQDLKYLLDHTRFTDEDIHKIMAAVQDLGGIEKAKAIASRYTEKAFRRIASLPECESKIILKKVTEGLLTRKH